MRSDWQGKDWQGKAFCGRIRRDVEVVGVLVWRWSGVGLALVWHAAVEHGVYSFNAQERGGYE